MASTGELPVLIGAVDLPVYKRDKASGPMVLCNGGLHLHALMLMPPTSRLKESLADHFRDKRNLYAGSESSIQRSMSGGWSRTTRAWSTTSSRPS
jgi:hypothetical protein